MTKDVLISISGLQAEAGVKEKNNEPIEIFTAGQYFFKNGKHYLLFEEVSEGIRGVTKSQIKLTGTQCLEVLKRGVASTHMIFDTRRKHQAYYETPYGAFSMNIFTKEIFFVEEEENIDIKVEYALDLNCEPLADCTIKINVKPKGAKDFCLCD